MSRFVRTLLITFAVTYLVAQFVELYLQLPVFAALSVHPSFHPFAFAWQWATYPFVEVPGDLSLISVAISLYVAANVFPVLESTFGTRTLATAIVAACATGGALGTLVALAFPPDLPASGSASAVQGALAFFLWSRRSTSMQFSLLPGTAATTTLTAKQMGAVLVGFALFHFALVREPSVLAVDLGVLLGGVGYGVLRERTASRRVVRHSLTVVRGGRGGRRPDHDLH